MGTMQVEGDVKRDLDDSGCVQDEPSTMKTDSGAPRRAQLLDLSDDVLLYILRHCSPRDLKALGFSCSRLASLVVERSLWRDVDARNEPCGRFRFKWFLDNALHSDTRKLLVSGYAREASGCLGQDNGRRTGQWRGSEAIEKLDESGRYEFDPDPDSPTPRRRIKYGSNLQQLPRYGGTLPWPAGLADERHEALAAHAYESAGGLCFGPRFTVDADALAQLATTCPALTHLALDYCNLNCRTTAIGHFPKTLIVLSLRGTRCYNVALDKSFLYKIQDHLPLLEEVDVSECEWLEPSSLLPLSKLQALKRLYARRAVRLSEFVAYASLATRYGFRNLEELDLRGCPVGDSEVSALGWLPALRALRLQAARRRPPPPSHHHGPLVPTPRERLLERWEVQEPECFKNGTKSRQTDPDDNGSEGSSNGDNADPDKKDANRKSGSKREKDGAEPGRSTDNRAAPVVNEESDPEYIDDEGFDIRGLTDDEMDDGPTYAERCALKKKDQVKYNEYKDCIDKEVNNEEKEGERRDVKEHEMSAGRVEEDGGSKRQIEDEGQEEGPHSKRRKDNGEDQDAVPGTSGQSAQASGYTSFDQVPGPSGQSNGEGSGNQTRQLQSNGEGSGTQACQLQSNGESSGTQARQPQEPDGLSEAERSARDARRERNKRWGPNLIVTRYFGDIEGQARPEEEAAAANCEDLHPDGVCISVIRRSGNVSVHMNPGEPITVRREEQAAGEGRGEAGGEQAGAGPPPDDGRFRGFICFRRGGNAEREAAAMADDPQYRALYFNLGQPHQVMYGYGHPMSFVTDRFGMAGGPPPEPAALVTDASLRRFGRAEGERVSYVLVGPLGPEHERLARPERSALEELVVRGYRHVTDRSLAHLASAAPRLLRLDVRGSAASARGVERFRALRPDCEVLFGPEEP